MEVSWIEQQWESVLAFFGHDDFNVNVWGTFLVSISIYFGLGTLFTIVDVTGKPEFILKYKVQNVKAYPITRAQLFDLLQVVIINELFLVPVAALAHIRNKGQKGAPISTQELPTIPYAIFSYCFFVICREISYYYSHRLFLHHPSIYKHIHKKHHSWTSPIALSATYAHPVEHFVSNVLPVMIGPMILKSHILLRWIYIAVVRCENVTNHSGYHLPWLKSPEFHDFHHLKTNYNFGIYGWLDTLHGTDSLFRKSKEYLRHKVLWSLKPMKALIP